MAKFQKRHLFCCPPISTTRHGKEAKIPHSWTLHIAAFSFKQASKSLWLTVISVFGDFFRVHGWIRDILKFNLTAQKGDAQWQRSDNF
jgi:hypothetical protein